jgi:hypothetical protein
MVKLGSGKVVHFDNPFDPLHRRTYAIRKPVTVRRLLRQRQGLRRHTSVRPIGGRRVREFNRPTVCLFNGKPLLRAQWSRTVVGPGDVVTFCTQLQGGGGGVLQVLGVVLAIAVAVAAPYIAGPAVLGFAFGSLGFSLATAGVGIVLSAAVGGLMSLFAGPAPPPATQAAFASTAIGGGVGGGAPPVSPTFSIGAQGNTARLEQPIPELLGRHVMFPDFAMQPYTRYIDNEQFVYSLLVPTRGSLEIEQVRIGDTPIESFEEIVWEQREPGELGDAEICDARWLTCRDLATVVLDDSSEGSPWKGPFATNPANTIVDIFEVDLVAPGGLYKYNNFNTFDTLAITVEIEAQEIDATGTAIGGWTAIDTEVKSAATQTAQRWTETYTLPSSGRWRVRLRRTDAKDFAATARHDMQWVGLRGRLTTERRFDGVTTVAVRMKATGDLNNQTSRQVNFIGTRKLPTWDEDSGTMSTTLWPTRSPCDAYAHIARTWNPDHKIDLAGLYANKAQFALDGWTFDYVFDTTRPTREALKMVARAVVGVSVEQGGKVGLVLDRASEAPAMVFTPRNIRKGSFGRDWKMVDEQTADGVSGTYMDPNSWKPVSLTEAFDDSPQENISKVGTEGITNRPQLRAVLWHDLRENRYRRSATSIGTEMEGLTLLYGDGIALNHDLPQWGQHAEVLAWDADTRTLTLSETMVFTEGATHFIALRDRLGLAAGPFEVSDGGLDARGRCRLVVGEGELPDILTGGDRERTIVQFGPGDTYARRLKVILVDPQDERTCDVVGCDDDPRMYEPIPAESTAPVGAATDALEIHVTESAANISLRAIANAGGYTGSALQPVTIVIDSGIDITSTSTSVAALVRGTWPPGFEPFLINRGTVSGAGGQGNGAAGGPALLATTGRLRVDNGSGIIRGGGGGGGRGGSKTTPAIGGSGGGGGRGHLGGLGGAGAPGADADGLNGGAGAPFGPGGGGSPASFDLYDGEGGPFVGTFYGARGGDGGDWGTAGQAGDAADTAGQGGGLPGAAVTGNANITWTSTGTRLGPIS